MPTARGLATAEHETVRPPDLTRSSSRFQATNSDVSTPIAWPSWLTVSRVAEVSCPFDCRVRAAARMRSAWSGRAMASSGSAPAGRAVSTAPWPAASVRMFMLRSDEGWVGRADVSIFPYLLRNQPA